MIQHFLERVRKIIQPQVIIKLVFDGKVKGFYGLRTSGNVIAGRKKIDKGTIHYSIVRHVAMIQSSNQRHLWVLVHRHQQQEQHQQDTKNTNSHK